MRKNQRYCLELYVLMCLIQSDILNAIRTTRLRMLVYLHLYTNMEEYVIVLAYQKEPH